jgi:predicted dehydrogenase
MSVGVAPLQRRELGIAIIGCGRIGSLRAVMASRHPAVRFIALADRDPERARALAERVGAQVHTADSLEAMSRPEINAVVVSTIEVEHTTPLLQALGLGKPVLVEKPLALDLGEADRIIAAAERASVGLHVGFSRRFKKRYLLAKEQLVQGRLGNVIGAAARVYNSRSQGMQTLSRLPKESNSISGLTYYVDVVNWLLAGNPPVEVYARAQGGLFKGHGFNTNDVTWAIVTHADGAVVNLGVCYALPREYPALGHAARVELLGSEGVLLIDDDHTDQIMYTEQGYPHVYIPEHVVNMVLLGSGTPGDWALGEFWGPVATETRAWLDHLSMGTQCLLATPRDARLALEVGLAIGESLKTGAPVRLPLSRSPAS